MTDQDKLDLAEMESLPDLDFKLNAADAARVAGAARELAKRKRSALNLFESQPHQCPFFESMASERILRGGNRAGKSLCGYIETARAALGLDPHGKFPTDRCLSGDTLVYDPVARKERRVDEIRGTFHVWSQGPDGQRRISVAHEPFVKGYGDLYDVSLSNGRTVTTTLAHRVLTADGQWVSIHEAATTGARLQGVREPLRQGESEPLAASDPPEFRTPAGFQDGYRPLSRSRDAQPLLSGADGPAHLRRQADVLVSDSLMAGSRDDLADTPKHIPLGSGTFHPSIAGGDIQVDCQPVFAQRPPALSRRRLCGSCIHTVRQFLVPSCRTGSPEPLALMADLGESIQAQNGDDVRNSGSLGGCRQFDNSLTPVRTFDESWHHISSRNSLACDPPLCHNVQITKITYAKQGAIYDFSVPGDENYHLAGLVHHNSLRIWLICFDVKQIGRTAYRMLFTSDSTFKIIRDPETKLFRAFRPWQEWDAEHAKEAIPAPPLIPPRYAPEDAFDWAKKGPRIFNSVRLRFPAGHPMDGTTIHTFSSASKPPMGDPVDVIHIDEDLQYPEHVAEFQARLTDNKGRLHWTVWPHTVNDALRDMSKRAGEDEDLDDPDVTETVIKQEDNPYLDRDELRKRLKGWSPEEQRSRNLGQFLFDTILVYPQFKIRKHGIPRDVDPGLLDEVLAQGRIPPDWTRYMIVDPGVGVTAVLFGAVPPPKEFGEVAVCYDELYIRQCNARIFAAEVSRKMGDVSFRAFIIDDHGSRVREAGSGLTVREQYTEELTKRNIRSETTGSGFVPGSDDVAGRVMEVQRWLTPIDDGTTRFRMLRGRLPNMEEEFIKYKRHITRDETKDKPVAAHNHLMNALEYWAAYNPRHHLPKPSKPPLSPGYLAFLEMEKFGRRGRPRRDSVRCGPGASVLSHTLTTISTE